MHQDFERVCNRVIRFSSKLSAVNW